MTLTAATCFSGIGAPEMAMSGWDWKFHAEIEKFPSAVMAVRHPGSINLGDVLAPDFIERAHALGPLDVMAGGPPCQGFSVAGLRGGMSDPRGNLTLRWVQILHAIKPRNAVTENVPGWLSMPDNAFGCFLAGLVGADDPLHSPLEGGKWPGQGMASGPRARVAWRILDAQYCGVAQRRRRVFVVADFGNGADPAQVLFERQGMLGNSPPSREKGKDIAPTIAARTRGGGGLGTDFDCDSGLIASEHPYSGTVSAKWAKGSGRPAGDEVQNLVATAFKPSHFTRGKDGAPSEISPPLTADADKGDQDAVVCVPQIYSIMPMNSGKDYKAMPVDVAQPLMTGQVGGNQGGDFVVQPNPIAFSSKDYGNDATSDLSPTLRAMPHHNSHPNGGGQMAIAMPTREVSPTITQNYGKQVDSSDTNEGPNVLAVAIQHEWAVRRLTPVECARLQGFPDDYLDITFRGKPAADGNKYKALGNSWAVPCGQWILERVERFMP